MNLKLGLNMSYSLANELFLSVLKQYYHIALKVSCFFFAWKASCYALVAVSWPTDGLGC